MFNTPRDIALIVLTAWEKSPYTLDKSLETHADQIASLSKNDKNLCNAIIFGVLRHRNAIDWIIKAFSNTPLGKINPTLLYLLRIAVFQIIYLDRVPVLQPLIPR